MAASRRGIGLGVLAALMLLAWSCWPSVPAPSGTVLAAAPTAAAAPRAGRVDAVALPGDENVTPAPVRREQRTSLQVRGRLLGRIDDRRVPLAGVALLLLRGDGDAPPTQFFRTAADGRFAVAVTAPLDAASVLCAGAEERVVDLHRQPAQAADDWDLGDVEFRGRHIRVTLALDCDREVVAAMLACHQLAVVASVHDTTGLELGNARFDLATCLDGVEVREQSLRCEVFGADPEQPSLSVHWGIACGCGGAASDLLLAQQQLQPGGADDCRAQLSLRPETSVRGRLLWADGSPRRNDVVQFAAAFGGPKSLVCTGSDGGFCFAVGIAAGRVGLPTEPGQRVVPGEIVELRTQSRALHFRLLDGRGPVRSFDVDTGGLVECRQERRRQVVLQQPSGAAADGTAALALEQVQRRPWLLFDLGDGEAHSFAVPPAWFSSPDEVHDLHTAQFTATGSLRVLDTAGAEAAALPRGLLLVLSPAAGDGGFTWRVDAPPRLPWSIDGIAAGQYDYEVRLASGQGNRGSGRLEIRSGEVTGLRLPAR